jgi:hypothetical protein
MKRRGRVMVASSMLLAMSLGLSGCGGGGIDEGTPKDLTPGKPLDSVTLQMPTTKAMPSSPPKVDAAPTTPGAEEKN